MLKTIKFWTNMSACSSAQTSFTFISKGMVLMLIPELSLAANVTVKFDGATRIKLINLGALYCMNTYTHEPILVVI